MQKPGTNTVRPRALCLIPMASAGVNKPNREAGDIMPAHQWQTSARAELLSTVGPSVLRVEHLAAGSGPLPTLLNAISSLPHPASFVLLPHFACGSIAVLRSS